MLCSGLVCISLSLVSTLVVTTVLHRKDATEPVVSREDRLELHKDVEAAEILAAVAAVLYMSYLWRTLFRAPAAQPQPTLADHMEEKQHEEGLFRRSSEHKETQLPEVQSVTAETQTSDCFLPVGWTSSDTQFSDSSLSVTAGVSEVQMHSGSTGTFLQPIYEAHTGGTSPGRPQTSTAPAILDKETTLDRVVQQVLELQVCKVSHTSEMLKENRPIGNVALPVESVQSETSEKTTSPAATDAQLYATLAKAQLPPSAGDFETPPNSASDVSSPDADTGLIVIREPAAHGPRSPHTFTVSLETGQSPRRSTPSPRTSEPGNSSLPTPKGGSLAGRRRVTCNRCRPQPGGQGNSQAPEGATATTVRVTALPCPATARGGGDAPQVRVVTRQPAAGRDRGWRPPAKNQQPLSQTYTALHYRSGVPGPRTQPTNAYKPPFI